MFFKDIPKLKTETTGQGSLICAMQEVSLDDHSIPLSLIYWGPLWQA